MNLRKCNGCTVFSLEDAQSSCCSSHVNLTDFGHTTSSVCDSENFYCAKCLHEGFCQTCQETLSSKQISAVGSYLDTGDSNLKWIHPQMRL